jgi:hypothetical protein
MPGYVTEDSCVKSAPAQEGGFAYIKFSVLSQLGRYPLAFNKCLYQNGWEARQDLRVP